MLTPSLPYPTSLTPQNEPLYYRLDHPVVQPQELKPGEALVNVLYSGVCHTDLHAHKGDWPVPPKVPLVGGYEGAGVIVAIGDYSNTTQCCESVCNTAFTNHLTPIPDGIPLEVAAPILCAGVTVYEALKQSNTKAGDYIVIAGAGDVASSWF